MNEKHWISHSVEETGTIAKDILEICEESRVFAIFGGLGAGKTTLVKFFCKWLGSGDVANSPTFSLVNEYAASGGVIYHFDFYRIKNIGEAFDIGVEEYFDSGEYCFIEWPEMIDRLLPEETVNIRLEALGANKRKIILEFQ